MHPLESTTLTDGDYELILEPEGGYSEDPGNVVGNITEALNQSSGDINISDPSATNEGQAPDINPLLYLHCNLQLYIYTCALSS
jgi:hypothetical protein